MSGLDLAAPLPVNGDAGQVDLVAGLDGSVGDDVVAFEPWVLEWVAYAGGSEVGPRTVVQVSRAGETVEVDAQGVGLIDAACHAVSEATGIPARLLAFRATAVEPGSGARAGVEVEVEVDGRRVSARASSSDVIEATAMAYLHALNLAHA